MLIYFLILLFTVVSFIILIPTNKKIKTNIFILLGVVLILIAGIGSEGLSKDYDNYLNAFNSQNLSATRMEPTFQLITLIVKSTLKDPIFLFLIYALIGVTIKFVAIREISNFILLSALIYLSNFFILHEMTQIRAGVAAGFLLLCISPLYNRNFLIFLVFSITAIIFHYSAIVILPLWFLKTNNLNRPFYFILIPVVYLLIFSGISISHFIEYIPIDSIKNLYLMHKYQMNERLNQVNLFNSLQLLRCAIAFLLIYKSNYLFDKNKYSILLIKIYILSIVSLVLFSDIPVVGFRISEFLGIVEIILFPMLLILFRPKQLSVFLPITLAIIFIFMNLFYLKLINIS